MVPCPTSPTSRRPASPSAATFDPEVEIAEQAEQLGTGHAVMATRPALTDFVGDIVILLGDVPLLPPEVVRDLIETHRSRTADVTLVGASGAPVTGSLAVGPDSVTFVATGGPLPADDDTCGTNQSSRPLVTDLSRRHQPAPVEMPAQQGQGMAAERQPQTGVVRDDLGPLLGGGEQGQAARVGRGRKTRQAGEKTRKC